ncbi:NAD-dependent epimerase/dehydratase family protein [Arthrobacter mobilis]|uniref:NAD-dependent epimerase/dehydratase family protein n=1 Tax=Arthrobacter mobilis TaxID=2724944 RepID=A0A7X6HCR0_9MICC|nr:NAD-dependent epimerase/dehydratase family protein [Arthrobacter mobilis]NKX54724.1 NAD-dependent epimerase/dehydratase family protein [Arthrobacter mobilis]
MRVAIIGATGNVGTALLRRIKQARRERGNDVQVIGIARRLPAASAEPYDGVEWHSIDIASGYSRERLVGALRECDAVVHLAWVLQPNHNEPFMRRINVDGTANVLAAAAEAGVRHFVCASSVGAYSPGPKDRPVDESWPARGIATSHYSRWKGEQEELLDDFERDHPYIPVARVRPGLIFQTDAGSQIGRYFLGPLVPKSFLNRLWLPLLPVPRQFKFQVVHAEDIADAYWQIVDQRASGAFNVAADPVFTPDLLAGMLGARRVLNVPVGLVRAVVGITWALRLQATDPGWIDMAKSVPVMSTQRVRRELGWVPRHNSLQALQAVLDGLSAGDGVEASPTLRPR